MSVKQFQGDKLLKQPNNVTNNFLMNSWRIQHFKKKTKKQGKENYITLTTFKKEETIYETEEDPI